MLFFRVYSLVPGLWIGLIGYLLAIEICESVCLHSDYTNCW